jgi:hypothetical protein
MVAFTILDVARVPIYSHFRLVAGDPLDGMLALAIELHWPRVFQGLSLNWHDTNFFYPEKDTLGYNDAFFLHGVIMSVLRTFRIDPFLSMQIVDWCFHGIGFIAMYIFGRYTFKWPVAVCSLCAALFVTANSYYQHDAVHAQFLCCFVIPILGILQVAAFKKCYYQSKIPYVYMVAFSLIFGSLLITTFYTAFFFMLFDCVTLLIILGQYLLKNWSSLRWQVSWVVVTSFFIQVFLIILCSLPLLIIYLPKVSETGMHRFGEILPFALRPIDVINVGPNNLLWSTFIQTIAARFGIDWPGLFEDQTGTSPLLFIIFLISGTTLFSRSTDSIERVILVAMWWATVFLLFLTIKWPYLGWIWGVVYGYIPGAAAIRVICRIQLVLYIPIVIVSCDFVARSAWCRDTRLLTCLVGLVLLLEQINDRPVFLIDRHAQNAFFNSISAPPVLCGAFFAENSRGGYDVDSTYRHNVDAMLVAELKGIPTLNGYATFLPRHWSLLHPEQPQYLNNLKAWMAYHPISVKVCGLNFISRRWDLSPFVHK